MVINIQPLKSWSQLNIYTSRKLCKFQDDGKKKAIIQKCCTKIDYIVMWIICSPTPSSFSHASNTHFSFKSTSTKIPWNILKRGKTTMALQNSVAEKVQLKFDEKNNTKNHHNLIFFCNCDYRASLWPRICSNGDANTPRRKAPQTKTVSIWSKSGLLNPVFTKCFQMLCQQHTFS